MKYDDRLVMKSPNGWGGCGRSVSGCETRCGRAELDADGATTPRRRDVAGKGGDEREKNGRKEGAAESGTEKREESGYVESDGKRKSKESGG